MSCGLSSMLLQFCSWTMMAIQACSFFWQSWWTRWCFHCTTVLPRDTSCPQLQNGPKISFIPCFARKLWPSISLFCVLFVWPMIVRGWYSNSISNGVAIGASCSQLQTGPKISSIPCFVRKLWPIVSKFCRIIWINNDNAVERIYIPADRGPLTWQKHLILDTTLTLW